VEEHRFHQPDPRWRGAADPASERLQDLRPDSARARHSDEDLAKFFEGQGYTPYFVEGDVPETVHQAFSDAGDSLLDIRDIQAKARAAAKPMSGRAGRLIVLRTPKGWTGPKIVDGLQIEGTFRAHQVPVSDVLTKTRAPADTRRLAAQLQAGTSCSTTRAGSGMSLPRWPGGHPADGVQSPRQCRPADGAAEAP
jgi:hypothetical protein